MKQEKILIVHNRYSIAGGEDRVVQEEKALLEKYGHEVVLYEKSNSELEAIPKVGYALWVKRLIFNRKTYQEVREILRTRQIDIMYVHNTFLMISPSVYYAAVELGIPVIQTIHNFRMFCPGALLYRDGKICEECITQGLSAALRHGCYHQSKAQTLMSCLILKYHRLRGIYRKLSYICLTDFSRQKFVEGMGKYIDPNRVYVKPNYLRDGAPDNSNDIETGREPYYIFVGRLSKEKGIDLLVQHWPNCWKVPLYIVGEGPLEAEIQETIRQSGKNIKMLGKHSHEEVLKYLYNAEAMIFSSVCYENLSMMLIESMMCGTPIICNAVGNSGAIVSEVAPELVINMRNREQLRNILMNYQKEQYGKKFREYYLNHYTEEISYRKLMEIIHHVMGEK